MNASVLMTLATVFAIAIALLAWLRWPAVQSAASVQRPVPDDPALPEIQALATDRLLRLPHFRRILDGSLFDFYRGTRLTICDCTKPPYPHLTLDYGGKQMLAFESAGGLEHYVAVQEAVAAMLVLSGDAAQQRDLEPAFLTMPKKDMT